MTFTFELTEELLQPVVRRLLNDDSAKVLTFDIRALKPGAGNPTSLGVYRVRGSASVGDGSIEFSLVVKHLANGLPMLDASLPTYWNFWRREISFFESALVERIPSSIGFPQYLGQSDLPDGTALFWNGDLGDLENSNWNWDECLNAARLVAELNSIDSAGLQNLDWLNRSQVAGWDELTKAWNSFEPTFKPLVELALSKPELAVAFQVFGPYMNRQDFIGEILNAGRHSFVHGDFNLNNLVPRRAGAVSLIALDWQLCGIARIGTEVAAIFNTAVEHKVCGVEAKKFDEICGAYTERFNELNPANPIEIDEVRLAAAAMGYFILQGMGFFFATPQPDDSPEQIQAKVQNLLNEFIAGPVMLYAHVLHELAPLSA